MQRKQEVNAMTRELTHRQSEFVAAFVESGDAHQAALSAGYAAATARTAGTEILGIPHVAQAVAQAVRERLVVSAPMALRVIEMLMNNDTISPKVRLDAAKAVLDRAGFVPPRPRNESNSGEKSLHEMSVDELRDMAAKLEDEIAGRAKDVSSTTTAAPVEDEVLAALTG
jgi:phage terminase small subunit